MRFWDPAGFKLENPVDRSQANPWCYIRFDDCAFVTNDLVWIGFPRPPEVAAKVAEYTRLTDGWLKEISNVEGLGIISDRCQVMASDRMFVLDSAWQFQHRRAVAARGLATHKKTPRNPGGACCFWMRRA